MTASSKLQLKTCRCAVEKRATKRLPMDAAGEDTGTTNRHKNAVMAVSSQKERHV